MSRIANIQGTTTMATSSMTLASSYSAADDTVKTTSTDDKMTHQEKVSRAIQQLGVNMSRYARANDRRMILRSMKEVKYLSNLPLDPVSAYDGPLADLENEVQTEFVTINGIAFRPGIELPTRNSCLATLRSLCDKLCVGLEGKHKPEDVYKAVVLRMARSTASADPYFQLNSFLGSSELLLQPIAANGGGKISGDLMKADSSDDSSKDTNPILVNIYVADDQIHITVACVFWFGLFRKSDVKPGKPWISTECLVHERTNLSNEQCVRRLEVKLPALY